jgi:hypothetical protein
MIPLPHEQLTNDQIIVRLATKLAGLKLMIEELEYKILDMVTAHIEQAKMEDLVAAAPKTEEDILLLAGVDDYDEVDMHKQYLAEAKDVIDLMIELSAEGEEH